MTITRNYHVFSLKQWEKCSFAKLKAPRLKTVLIEVDLSGTHHRTFFYCNGAFPGVTLYFLSLWFLRESNRDGDAEMEAFRGSKSPKKAVDPLSYIKVCLRHSSLHFFFQITKRTETRPNARKHGQTWSLK